MWKRFEKFTPKFHAAGQGIPGHKGQILLIYFSVTSNGINLPPRFESFEKYKETSATNDLSRRRKHFLNSGIS